MKNINYVINGVLAVAVIILFVMQFSSKKESTVAPAFTTEGDSTNLLPVAYVNVDSLLANYNYSKDLNERILKMQEDYRLDMTQRSNALRTELNDFQRKYEANAFLTTERAQQEGNRLQKKQEELQNYAAKKEQELAAKQMEKKGNSVVEGEDLDILIGSMPAASDSDNTDENKEEKEAVKKNILAILKEKYGIEEEDFLSAELEAVPAGPARDYGLDRSMIMGYGHDDRVCAYPSLIALLNTPQVTRTGVCILVDKEEIGSVGATGMHSRFFENMVAEVMDRCGDYSELKLRRALANSYMLSSDVSAAYDPNYASVFEKKNSAFFGKGMVFNKYTGSRGKSGSNDASAEFIGKLRKVMDDAEVYFQMAELGKVDAGGGGTIAYILANLDMNVIDSGIAVQNMHAPYEVISKADLYETLKGYEAFLQM